MNGSSLNKAKSDVKNYKAIFIPDIHLGSKACPAEFLLDFLKHNDSEKLYLVGDIVDGWRSRWGQSLASRFGSKGANCVVDGHKSMGTGTVIKGSCNCNENMGARFCR